MKRSISDDTGHPEHRAARYARSAPLVAATVALVILTSMRAEGNRSVIGALIPGLTFLAILAVTSVIHVVVRAQPGREGYGVIAAMLLGLLFVPFGMWGPIFLGAEFFLGVGLVIVGWRGKDSGLWIPGVVLLAVGPFINLNGAANTVPPYDSTSGVVVLALTTAVFAALAATAIAGERRVRAGGVQVAGAGA